MYLVLLIKSRRFVEYFPPSAVMFLAFATRERLKNLEWTRVTGTWARAAAAILIGILFWFSAYSTIQAARTDVASEPATIAYRGGAQWLAQNTPAGSAVFHTDWDDFQSCSFTTLTTPTSSDSTLISCA